MIWRFVALLREHFVDDERGRRRTLRFLPWHLDFFCRYRPLPGSGLCGGGAAPPTTADPARA